MITGERVKYIKKTIIINLITQYKVSYVNMKTIFKMTIYRLRKLYEYIICHPIAFDSILSAETDDFWRNSIEY